MSRVSTPFARIGIATAGVITVVAATLFGTGVANADTHVDRTFDMFCQDPKLAGTITAKVTGDLPDSVPPGTVFGSLTFEFTAEFGPEMAKAIRAKGGSSAVGIFGTQVHAKDSAGNFTPAATVDVRTPSVPLPPTDVPMTFTGSASYPLHAPNTPGPASLVLASAAVIRAQLDTGTNVASQCGFRGDRTLGGFTVR
ncbi:DUF6801 domain-containing protein [Nocardia altamirensis]|uniref:DUF6801 domain-containing protein n=1 Tax=Nocardia altamirensis TaxID=472158 RepID=UPI00084069B0|nr:DUF6801 domain-containing protein [Nocardia altamirensis]